MVSASFESMSKGCTNKVSAVREIIVSCCPDPEDPTHRPRPPNATLRRLHSCPHPARQHSESQSCPWEIIARRKEPCSTPGSANLPQAHAEAGTEQEHGAVIAPCVPQANMVDYHPPTSAVAQARSPIANSSSEAVHPLKCIDHREQAATTDLHCLGQENCPQVGNCQVNIEEVEVGAKGKLTSPKADNVRQGHPQPAQDRQRPDAEHLRMPFEPVACCLASEDPAHGRMTPAIASACDAPAAPIPLLSPARCHSVITAHQDCKEELQTLVASSAVPTSDVRSDQQLAAVYVHHMDHRKQAAAPFTPAANAYSQKCDGQLPQHDVHANHNSHIQARQHAASNATHSISGKDHQAFRPMASMPRSSTGLPSPAAHTSQVTPATTAGVGGSMPSPLTAPNMAMQHGWAPMENQSGSQIPPSGMSHMPAGAQFVPQVHPYTHQTMSAPAPFMMGGAHLRQHTIPPQGYSRQSPSLQPTSGQAPNMQYSMQQYMFQQGQQQLLQGGNHGMMLPQFPTVGNPGMQQQNSLNPGMNRGFAPQMSPYVPATGYMPQHQVHIQPHLQQQHQHPQQYQRPERGQQMNCRRFSMPTPNSHMGLQAVPACSGIAGMSSASTAVPVTHGTRRDYGTAFPGATTDDAQTAAKKTALPSMSIPAAPNVTPPQPSGLHGNMAIAASSPLDIRSAPAGPAATPIQTPPTFAAAMGAPGTEKQLPQCKTDSASGRSTGASTPQPIWGGTAARPVQSARHTDARAADVPLGAQKRSYVCKEPGSHSEAPKPAAKMMSAEEVKELQERAQSGMSESERQKFLDSCWLLSNDVAPETVPSSRKGKGLAKASEDTRNFSLRRTTGNNAGSGSAQQPHQVPRRDTAGGRRGGQSLDSFWMFATAADAACKGSVAPSPSEQLPLQPCGESNHTYAAQKDAAQHTVPSTSGPIQQGGFSSAQNPSAANCRRTPPKRPGAAVVAGQNRSRSGFNCPRAAAVQRAGLQASGAVEACQTGSGEGEQVAGTGTTHAGMRRSDAAGARTAVRGGGIAAAVASAGTEGAVVATGFVRGGSGSAVMAPQSRVTAARQNRLLHDAVCQDEQ